jgi:pSer/pThr/pTyr-binding forkhead associated (FHA) protein
MEVILELSGHPKANVKKVVISDTVVVGRSQKCGLQIASAAVSRRHCEIRVRGNAVSAIDLGSSNGTFIDALRLSPGDETPLPSGARLNVGGVRFMVQYAAAPSSTAEPPGFTAAGASTVFAAAVAADVSEDDIPVIGSEAALVGDAADETPVEESTQEPLHEPLAVEPIDDSLADESPAEVDEPVLETVASDDTLQPVPDFIDDEPDLDAMFAEPASAAEPSSVGTPLADAPDEDVPILEEDEDAAFSFLTDDDDDGAAQQKASSKAEDSRLGDFLSQLGRD